MAEVYKALILGIVQGITEFIPISSSGHLNLVATYINLDSVGTTEFSLIVHVATVLSTLIVFRREVLDILAGFVKSGYKSEKNYLYLLIYSALPLVFILPLRSQLETFFDRNLLITALGFLVTACILFSLDRYTPKKKNGLTIKNAILIGFFQVFALIPGISRSGATISGGLLLGIKKEEAAKFAFLMLIIPLLAAGVLDFIELIEEGWNSSSLILFIGFVSAFITGLAACRATLEIVKKSSLSVFSYYLFFIAGVTIVLGIM